MSKVTPANKNAVSKAGTSPTSKKLINEPLITVRNPLSYIFYWLDDIKNWIKKDSNGEIRIHIPFKWFLTALCMFTVGGAIPAYWQGKAVEYAGWIAKPTPTPVIIVRPTLTPAPVLVTRLGVIKATYQVRSLIPTATPTPLTASPSSALSTEQTPVVKADPTPARFVLMTDTYKLIYLKTPSDVSLQKYVGYKALVTGLFSASANAISVEKLEDIEVVY